MQRLTDRALRWAAPRVLHEAAPDRESPARLRRRRRVTAATLAAGTGLLGVSLSTEPDSKEFYGLTFAVAGTLIAGGLASGPVHLGRDETADGSLVRPVAMPVLLGVGSFAGFYAAALVARKIPFLDEALRDVLAFADEGRFPLVLATTLANGVAEEVLYRGALYASVGEHPVARSSAIYALATAASRNPALVLAAEVMGALFALQRRATGGIQAPVITHLTWSTLMMRFVPPLFAGGTKRSA